MSIKAILLSCIIEVQECQDVVIVDIPRFVHIHLQEKMAYLIIQLNQPAYLTHATHKQERKVLV